MPKLTKTLIDSAHSSTRERWLWDTDLPGFGVRIHPSGRKTYVVRYRNKRNQGRKYTLARVCDMPPQQARDLARGVFASVACGNDPAEEKKANSEAPTVEGLLIRYMEQHARNYLKKSSVQEYTRKVRCLVSRIGKRRVMDLTRQSVQSMHASMSSTPVSANRSVSVLSAAFTWAQTVGVVERGFNPCNGVKLYPEKHREHILTADQVAAMNRELDSGNYLPSFKMFVRLLMLTGCRKNEILSARREWIDYERGLLILPDSKTGPKSVLLPASALELVKRHQGSDTDWLIPNITGTGPVRNVYPMWKRLTRNIGVTGTRIHDIRHTVGSRAHMAGLSQRQIADILGHKKLRTTERYLHGSVNDRTAIETVASVMA